MSLIEQNMMFEESENNLIELPMIPQFCELMPDVQQNRTQSRNLLNQILALKKINGNIQIDLNIPNFYELTNYNDQTTYNKNQEPYLSAKQNACGDEPRGLKFRAKSRFYDCLDTFNPKYAIEQNCILASQKERLWLDAKLKELVALTGQKVVLNTSEQDFTNRNNPNSNYNTLIYIGATFVIGFVAYKMFA